MIIEVFEPTLTIHDFVLGTISLVSIIGYFGYSLKKRKRIKLPDALMIGLLASLFMGILCFMLVQVPLGTDKIGCEAVAALVQYFFLASTMWSNCLAFSITRSLYTMSLGSQSLSKLKFYALYALGIPLICVLVTTALSKLNIEGVNPADVHKSSIFCFLQEEITMYGAFLIPFYISIAANMALSTATMVKVVQSGRTNLAYDRNRRQKNLITAFKLALCLGLGWGFLIVAMATKDPGWFMYMHIFVELQGALVVCSTFLSWDCMRSAKSWTQSQLSSMRASPGNAEAESSKPKPREEVAVV